jgi:hypothetical protein
MAHQLESTVEFLELPGEIRNYIYQEFFLSYAKIGVDNTLDITEDNINGLWADSKNFFATNPIIQAEASSLFLEGILHTVFFRFETPYCLYVTLLQLPRRERAKLTGSICFNIQKGTRETLHKRIQKALDCLNREFKSKVGWYEQLDGPDSHTFTTPTGPKSCKVTIGTPIGGYSKSAIVELSGTLGIVKCMSRLSRMFEVWDSQRLNDEKSEWPSATLAQQRLFTAQ